MANANAVARELVAALNARDYAAIAALADEDVAISGFGEGGDMGREALRERLARHFSSFDESYGDAVTMVADGGSPVAIRVTARGSVASGKSYSVEKVLLLELDGDRIARMALMVDEGERMRQVAG